MLGLKSNELRIVPYDDKWKDYFEAEKILIKEKLKDHFELDNFTIYHIGSTSIPRISSKPIIDMMLVSKKFELYSSKISFLLNFLGYEQVSWDLNNECIFLVKGRDEDREVITHHIHIVSSQSRKYEEYLLFKNFLTKNYKYAQIYKRRKIELVSIYPNDRGEYRKAKGVIVNKVLKIAELTL
ncbi:GrpB family protein [Clostridium sp. D2Q-11]|uniref:GrpB family protein n=1 Tax=Anaeromonas frigoriresistens TaxID=2683708 RepID=A0A942UZE7_9FIRM|nr:GrpB family protein [Anaeromonas frigoriresistens]MBS4538377.1 GrpB family protein [Anaeromonas frigoriresistens]